MAYIEHANEHAPLLGAARRDRVSVPDARFNETIALALAEFLAIIVVGYLTDVAYDFVVYDGIGSRSVLGMPLIAASLFVFMRWAGGDYATYPTYASAGTRGKILRNWVFAVLGAVAVAVYAKHADTLSRATLAFQFVAGFGALVATHTVIDLLIDRMVKADRYRTRRLVLIGTANDLNAYAQQRTFWRDGIALAGSIVLPTENGDHAALWLPGGIETRLDADPDTWLKPVRRLQPDDVIVVTNAEDNSTLTSVFGAFHKLPANLYLSLDPVLGTVRSVLGDTYGQTFIAGQQLAHQLCLPVAGLPIPPLARAVKRGADIILSGLGLLCLSPLLLAVAAAIKLESPGPVLFRQARNGFNEHPFDILKFRSMRHEERDAFVQTQHGDARVTRVGRFIRRTNIDELPQLINVFLGDMSLVGPRPHAVEHNEQFMDMIADYARRHHVKPGITGWAQVNGWRGPAEDLEHMHQRVAHDLDYIANWSLLRDIQILWLTVFSKRAYKNAR